jgi:hypothetical protein
LQRISALLVGFFLLFHVGTLCSWGLHAIYGFTHLPLLHRRGSLIRVRRFSVPHMVCSRRGALEFRSHLEIGLDLC